MYEKNRSELRALSNSFGENFSCQGITGIKASRLLVCSRLNLVHEMIV